ncbi:hypothetical protein HHK36_005930 [Tetracentron sinense]|uniref:Pentatricopeptide repeat-containing protein n=1 Tax=Tetracentron sinense TaxID=13715 RepID=A0A834ZGA2_TETSI|nr:hypothetical protein HHK36_005930 [Tetracentron sinense]
MDSRYSIILKLEHYACYVDLLARVGQVEEALGVVSSMPVEPNGLVWGALLGGCLVHSKVDLARDVAKRLVEVDPVNSGGYVLLSNVFAANRQWDEIVVLRGLMREKEVRKQPVCSWISVDGVVHEFLMVTEAKVATSCEAGQAVAMKRQMSHLLQTWLCPSLKGCCIIRSTMPSHVPMASRTNAGIFTS